MTVITRLLGHVPWVAVLLIGAGCDLGTSSGGGLYDVTLPTDAAATDTAAGTTAGTVTAVGVVYGPGTLPMAGVQVHSGTSKTLSDATGHFNLDLGKLNSAVIVLEKDGFSPAYRQVKSNGSSVVTVSAVLTPLTTSTTIVPAQGGEIALGGGATVQVPAGALVNGAGSSPTSPAQVKATWLPPDQAEAMSPFLLQAMDGGELTPLVSYGMLDLTVQSDGQPLQLKAGSSAQLKVPAQAADPDSTGLFFGNPATGMWELQGAAAKVSGMWVAELPHLSWWNLDGFYKVPTAEQACVTFRAVGASGVGIPGVEIRSKWGKGYTIAGGTDSSGLLCHAKFPGGVTLSVQWKAAMAAGAAQVLQGTLSVTPSAYGATCGTSECQVVDIPIQCTSNSQCGKISQCVAGLCTGSGGIGGSDAGSSDAGSSDTGAPTDKPCVPTCKPNQCSDDGCGKPCASCPSGQSCNGESQVCETCKPDCTGQTCGTDGCTGTCGMCKAGTSCDGQKCVSPCSFCPGGACDSFGFENGLGGWDTSGDIVVVEQMGPATAPEGKKMLRLSTGLSFAAPSWAQRAMCASPGVTKVTFQWRMYSEEFDEYCGSSYQDYFAVWLLNPDGTKSELGRWTIDDLCPKGQHSCDKCGAKSVGITKTDVKFDKGDVWATPWQTTTLPLPSGASTATLVWEVSDVGDSAYDTVVLLDGIVLSK